jgi:hypothetical protein
MGGTSIGLALLGTLSTALSGPLVVVVVVVGGGERLERRLCF